MESQLVLFMTTLLRGGAATWWCHMERSGEYVPNTWASFCKAFHVEFKPSNSEQLACTQLKQLKQNRTIAEYVVAFCDIMLELPNMDGEDAKDQFIQGL
ncbi:hypothetical protein DFQ29_003580, partial [Apophysomyces sp. BC1021]